MKVIIKDNFCRENVSERVLIPRVSEEEGTIIADAFNRVLGGAQSSYFYKCVDDEYDLYKFEP